MAINKEFKFEHYSFKSKQVMANLLELFVINKESGVVLGFSINGRGNPPPEYIFEIFKQTYRNWFIEVEIIQEKPEEKLNKKDLTKAKKRGNLLEYKK